MRKIFLSVAISLFLFPQVTFAAEIQINDRYILERDIIINDNLIVTGGEMYINGQIQGDMIAAGGEIHIHGKISGDLIAAGGTVHIYKDAQIGRNVRLAGGKILLEGAVTRDVDMFAGEIEILGSVSGNVRMTGRDILLDGTIAGSVKAESENITLGSTAHIRGDFKHFENSIPVLIAGSKVDGTISTLPQNKSHFYQQSTFWFTLIIHTIAYWLLALLLLSFFARSVQKNTESIQNHFWQNAGIGLLSIIVGISASILLAITIIGMPLGIILFTATVAIIYLGQIPFAFYVTQRISGVPFHQEHNRLLVATYLLGSIAIISILGAIPVLGPIFKVIITFAGVGTVLREKRSLYHQLQEKELI